MDTAPSFIAVKRGKMGLQKCIFLDWRDCQQFVVSDDKNSTNDDTMNEKSKDDESDVYEFCTFNTVVAAISYLQPSYPQQSVHQTEGNNRGIGLEVGVGVGVEGNDRMERKEGEGGGGESVDKRQDSSEQSTSAARNESSSFGSSRGIGSSCLNTMTTMREPAGLGPSWNHHDDHNSNSNSNKNGKKGVKKPRKQWISKFHELKSFYEQHGHFHVPNDDENKRLYKFVCDQRKAYKTARTNNTTAAATTTTTTRRSTDVDGDGAAVRPSMGLTEGQLQWLQSIHFDFHECTWDDRYEEYKLLLQRQHNLRTQQQQEQQERQQQERRPSGLNDDDPTDMIESNDDTMDLPDNSNDSSNNTNTNTNMSTSGEDNEISLLEHDRTGLKEWLMKQRHDLETYRKGRKKKDCELNQHRVELLREVGIESEADKEYNSKFDEMLSKFKEYRQGSFGSRDKANKESDGATGSTGVKDSELQKWILKQRSQYKLLKEKKACQLTYDKVHELLDAGFAFSSGKRKAPSWEERLEELKRYKTEHGHCKVPRVGGFGAWITAQRTKYRSGGLTEEQVQSLQEVGLDLNPRPQMCGLVNHRKSWDGMFEELLDFKERHGHCVVPQLSGKLGMWVKDQRRRYKRMKSEVPLNKGRDVRPLTTAQFLKLVEVGFVFDTRSNGKLGGVLEVEGPSNGKDFGESFL